MKLLFKAGVNVSVQATYGNTALIGAFEEGHTEVAKLLLEASTYTNNRDRNGKAALTLAKENKHKGIVQLLS